MSPEAAAEALWRPAATLPVLRRRAALLARARAFFADRGVLEVETPLVAATTVTAPHLESLGVVDPGGQPAGWLQTSPEYGMKRLLAAHPVPMVQICKAFRAGEAGSRHNPEFTLVEWYRPGVSLAVLMDEAVALVGTLLDDRRPARRRDYAELFAEHTGIDPFRCSDRTLADQAAALGLDPADAGGLDRDGLLDLVFSHGVQPHLGRAGPELVTGFPASQAALARVAPGPPAVAERCELYLAGMELANGYQELTDAAELERRWRGEQAVRQAAGRPVPAMDARLLAAQRSGLPECAGVALGFDRVVMLATGCRRLEETLAFPGARA